MATWNIFGGGVFHRNLEKRWGHKISEGNKHSILIFYACTSSLYCRWSTMSKCVLSYYSKLPNFPKITFFEGRKILQLAKEIWGNKLARTVKKIKYVLTHI